MIQIVCLLLMLNGALTGGTVIADCHLEGCYECDDTGEVCLAECSTLCDTCVSPTKCTLCIPGSTYLSNGECFRCGEYCQECNNSTSCNECYEGYDNHPGGGQCHPCPNRCDKCHSNSTCMKCDDGYYINEQNKGRCESCSSNCVECNNSTSCTKCKRRYAVINAQCEACPSNCLECDSSTSCTSCQRGYAVVNGQCEVCSSNCLDCNSTSCISCSTRYHVENGLCEACSSNCLECDSTSCTRCLGGYHVENELCEACSSNCWTCDSTSCIRCLGGYHVENGLCEECTRTSRPMHNYPDLYRGNIIFVDFTFQCNGLLTGVDLYVKRSGTVYFTAWRPSASGTSWSLIGITNAIVVEGRERGGPVEYRLDVEDRFHVRGSDVFGIVYPAGSKAIITSENIRKRHRDGTSSRFIRTRDTREDLYIGISKSGLAGNGRTERIVPINPRLV